MAATIIPVLTGQTNPFYSALAAGLQTASTMQDLKQGEIQTDLLKARLELMPLEAQAMQADLERRQLDLEQAKVNAPFLSRQLAAGATAAEAEAALKQEQAKNEPEIFKQRTELLRDQLLTSGVERSAAEQQARYYAAEGIRQDKELESRLETDKVQRQSMMQAIKVNQDELTSKLKQQEFANEANTIQAWAQGDEATKLVISKRFPQYGLPASTPPEGIEEFMSRRTVDVLGGLIDSGELDLAGQVMSNIMGNASPKPQPNPMFGLEDGQEPFITPEDPVAKGLTRGLQEVMKRMNKAPGQRGGTQQVTDPQKSVSPTQVSNGAKVQAPVRGRGASKNDPFTIMKNRGTFEDGALDSIQSDYQSLKSDGQFGKDEAQAFDRVINKLLDAVASQDKNPMNMFSDATAHKINDIMQEFFSKNDFLNTAQIDRLSGIIEKVEKLRTKKEITRTKELAPFAWRGMSSF